jgi:hypothetical protein
MLCIIYKEAGTMISAVPMVILIIVCVGLVGNVGLGIVIALFVGYVLLRIGIGILSSTIGTVGVFLLLILLLM